jgi:methyl halide transferase
MSSDAADFAFWDRFYEEAGTGAPPWDAGGPAPPLSRVLAREAYLATPRDVAFVGSGRGHDAIAWALPGHRVVGFDFAPLAIEDATRRAEAAGVAGRCRFERRDIFTLGEAYPRAFDAVVEYTCFCAIPPGRRADYVRNVAAALRPGGLFVGLFYHIPGVAGPPFPVRREHVAGCFLADSASPFELLSEERPADSVERRVGKEQLMIFRRKEL